MFSRFLIAVAAAAVVLGGSVCAKAAEVLNFGIISTESSQNLKQLWNPFLADMEKATGHQIRYFVDRYGIKMDDSGSYVNGTYTNRIWQKDGVPMVRFTVVEGRAHSWRPEETAVFWNEWFSQFSRGEDGSLIYQGE